MQRNTKNPQISARLVVFCCAMVVGCVLIASWCFWGGFDLCKQRRHGTDPTPTQLQPEVDRMTTLWQIQVDPKSTQALIPLQSKSNSMRFKPFQNELNSIEISSNSTPPAHFNSILLMQFHFSHFGSKFTRSDFQFPFSNLFNPPKLT